jgi:hypothetical protein
MAFYEGFSMLCPYHPPPKDTICHWDWGEGAAAFDLAQKLRARDAIIMSWTKTKMTTMTMATTGRGKRGKKH